MSKKNKNLREKETNTKDLGIKVGDWFEEITNWPNPKVRCFYYVKYLDYKYISLIMIYIDSKSNALIEISCLGWEIELFRRSKKNRLIFNEEIVFENRNEEDVLDRLKKVKAVSLLLTCFWKNIDPDLLPRKDNPQNQPTSQSTPPENKPMTEEDLDIKIGDWFEIPQIYAESKGKDRRFLRVEKVTNLSIDFKEVNVEPTNPDVYHTIEVWESPWFIKYFHKNADGTFFWETEREGRLDFERRDIDVVRKEVTSCLNLEIEDELRHLNLLEIKPEEKLKKSDYLKYVKDNEVYYLHDPKYQIKEILGQEKFCVIASGITIINNRINHHSCNGDELNLIRLMFDNEEEFFNNVKEITKEEFDKLWSDLI